jgi:aminopeptidase N
MYYKGANMLHTLRQIVADDEKFRQMIRGLSKQFYHQTVTTQQIENYLSMAAGRNLTPFFNQYLRDKRIPVFEYALEKDILKYRWSNCVPGFDMPLKITVNDKPEWVYPATDWKQLKVDEDSKIVTDNNFYIQVKDLRDNQ